MQKFEIQTQIGPICCGLWLPEQTPVGVVQIIHGIADSITRYDAMAQSLTRAGYIVVGEDHPGHGMSGEETGRFGYLNGGWMGTVKIIRQLRRHMAQRYGDLPYFMLGHSMGSFLLRTYLFTYRDDSLTGAILSGTGWQPSSLIAAASVLSREETARLGEENTSKLMNDLVFGGYNKKFAPTRTPYDWVCANPQAVDAYAANPYCTWTPTIQLCTEMLRGILMIQKQEHLLRMRKDLPVYFFSGQQDPVGSMGNGVLKCVQKFKDAGLTDVSVELYAKMRHECHNELDRERVFADLVRWICSKSQNGCNL